MQPTALSNRKKPQQKEIGDPIRLTARNFEALVQGSL